MGQQAIEFPCMPDFGPECGAGYTLGSGDVGGWNSINGKGGQNYLKANSQACADDCDSERTCMSYEYYKYKGICTLNTRLPSGNTPHGQTNCIKELCPMPENP